MLIFKKNPISIVFVAVLIFECAFFTSHYDATRHENFTKLQAFHVKFIKDYTEGSGKEWIESDVKKACDAGDLKFMEALVYARSKDNKDSTGSKAVENLGDQFQSDCRESLDKEKLFGKGWSTEHLEQILENYNYAVSGELERVGSPK